MRQLFLKIRLIWLIDKGELPKSLPVGEPKVEIEHVVDRLQVNQVQDGLRWRKRPTNLDRRIILPSSHRFDVVLVKH